MEIIRAQRATQPGPVEWFTGQVWLDHIVAAPPPPRARAISVHFTPGARTAWHHHPAGQVIHVTEGSGLAQRRGGPVEAIRAGDSVRFDPHEEHWHGAAPDHFMTHLAIHEADDDGANAVWGPHVTDAEYRGETAG